MDEANREDGEEDTSSNMRICIRCTQHKPVTLFAKPGRKEDPPKGRPGSARVRAGARALSPPTVKTTTVARYSSSVSTHNMQNDMRNLRNDRRFFFFFSSPVSSSISPFSSSNPSLSSFNSSNRSSSASCRHVWMVSFEIAAATIALRTFPDSSHH
jgi:hypothetical protein